MFEVGAYIVHPGQGVCRVEGVGEGPDATYKLLPLGQRHPVHISYPVASEGRLRRVLSAQEARQIIDDYASMDVDTLPSATTTLRKNTSNRRFATAAAVTPCASSKPSVPA